MESVRRATICPRPNAQREIITLFHAVKPPRRAAVGLYRSLYSAVDFWSDLIGKNGMASFVEGRWRVIDNCPAAETGSCSKRVCLADAISNDSNVAL